MMEGLVSRRFPVLLDGGNHLIAPGIVVAPGMRIRNPALLKPTLFARQLKEILQVWSTTPSGPARETLSERVMVMWLQYVYFRRVAAHAYERNKTRTARMQRCFIRFSCCCPNGALVSLKLSPLATVHDVKRAVAAKSAAKCKRAARDAKYAVFLGGEPLHDATCLEDAGVRRSSTLVLTVACPGTSDVEVPVRPLAGSGDRRRSTLAARRGSVLGADKDDAASGRLRPSFFRRSLLPAVTTYGPRDRQADDDLWSRPTTASASTRSRNRSRPNSRPGTSGASRPGSKSSSRPQTRDGVAFAGDSK